MYDADHVPVIPIDVRAAKGSGFLDVSRQRLGRHVDRGGRDQPDPEVAILRRLESRCEPVSSDYRLTDKDHGRPHLGCSAKRLWADGRQNAVVIEIGGWRGRNRDHTWRLCEPSSTDQPELGIRGEEPELALEFVRGPGIIRVEKSNEVSASAVKTQVPGAGGAAVRFANESDAIAIRADGLRQVVRAAVVDDQDLG